MADDFWRPNWKLPRGLQARAIALRAKLGYATLEDWAIDVVTKAVDAQEAEVAEAERERRSRP